MKNQGRDVLFAFQKEVESVYEAAGVAKDAEDQNMSEYWLQEKRRWNELVWGSIHKHSDKRVKNAIENPREMGRFESSRGRRITFLYRVCSNESAYAHS